MNNTLNLQQPAKKIAEDAKEIYSWANIPEHLQFDFAEILIENMIQTFSKWDYRQEASKHQLLSEVLEILKQESKS